jgi:hypothetical protein
MEDVLQIYQRPYAEDFPVICLDEASKQLIGEITPQEPARPGTPARIDYEYVRNGTCNLFMMCEPLRGWRHVEVTTQRTRHDWAQCIKALCDEYYPKAQKIVLVEDNLNTHGGASLYETFSPPEARRLLDRIEFHPTPKHGSWLDMAEIELRVLNRQCLDRRIESADEVRREVAAWEQDRNDKECKIHWTFAISTARQKMKTVYPSIED